MIVPTMEIPPVWSGIIKPVHEIASIVNSPSEELFLVVNSLSMLKRSLDALEVHINTAIEKTSEDEYIDENDETTEFLEVMENQLKSIKNHISKNDDFIKSNNILYQETIETCNKYIGVLQDIRWTILIRDGQAAVRGV